MIRWTFHFFRHQPEDKDSASIDVSEDDNDIILDALAHSVRLGDSICATGNYNLPFVNLDQVKAITRYVLPVEQTEQPREPVDAV